MSTVPSAFSSRVSNTRTESARLVRIDCSLRQVEPESKDGAYDTGRELPKALECVAATETAIEEVGDSERSIGC